MNDEAVSPRLYDLLPKVFACARAMNENFDAFALRDEINSLRLTAQGDVAC